MKYFKRFTAALTAALLLLPMSVSAAAATPKEEVVYVNLNADGTVKEVNIVNIFELAADGSITDYGEYESLRNMTTTDEINYSGDAVSINTQKGKLYYEGKSKNNDIPWDIDLRYFIGGKEYTSDKLAGMSGGLMIKLSITENPNCRGDFFEGYALQATVTLDTGKCRNIKADGATVANVGGDKQITYTILPGKGAEIELFADVTDFEMKSIAINGVQLGLNIEVDDSEIQEKINKITDAVHELDDGAGELNDGVYKLYKSVKILREKTGELNDGAEELNEGTADLAGGLNAITAKNAELLNGARSAFEGLCGGAQTVLNAELEKNGLSPVTLTPDTYGAVLTELLKQLNVDEVYNQAYNAALAEVTAQVEAQADTLYAGYIDANAPEIYLNYMQTQADDLYAQAAAQAVLQQLIAGGMSESDAQSYLETADGQAAVAQAVADMTDEQKQQVLLAAVNGLSDEQKSQIKAGALAALTEEQKTQIRDGYIEQMMASPEVTEKIADAVAAVNAAGAKVAELKGQLDNYRLFCNGLSEYTSAVSTAAGGAGNLNDGMAALKEGTDSLYTAAGKLKAAVAELYSGTNELKEGTTEFSSETAGIDQEVSDEIDSLISAASGGDMEVVSFASEKNVNIEAVQFVMQTEKIEMEKIETVAAETEEQLTFWQKLLRLFGVY